MAAERLRFEIPTEQLSLEDAGFAIPLCHVPEGALILGFEAGYDFGAGAFVVYVELDRSAPS